MINQLRKEQLVQGHGIDVLAVLIDAHIAGGNFVNEHNIAVSIVAELKLDVVQIKTLFLQVVGNDLGSKS